MDDWRYLVLYDGQCGLCDRSVQWLLRKDRRRSLRFAPLQGDTAKPFTDGATHFDTMILVEKEGTAERVYHRSRAIFRILRAIGGGWRLLSWLRFLPAFLTDLPYRVVARYRVRWFGTTDASCRMATPEERKLFLP